ncbi:hypothetical protein [Halomonas sp. GT]|uniref:hypothetical protein n=1 Tax=Halomonas sp. GT TaxID=1971364 RepID=UPI0009F4D116|nr:hypothetical protein [Halomonas sp. GT]
MSVQPYDEAQIANEDDIIRRVCREQHVIFDENLKRERVSSKLFSASSGPNDGMSVDIPRLMEADETDVKEFVTTPVFTGSVVFKSVAARGAGLIIGYDPIAANPYHGEVWNKGTKPNRFSKGQKNALAKASEWLVALEGVELN